jgi:putative membrane protein
MTSGQTVLDILLSKMQQLNTQLDSYDTILTALISVTDSASSAMNAAGQISPDMSKKIIAEQQKVDSLMKIASKGNILDSSVSSQLAAGLGQISQIMDSVINIYSKADGNIDSFASSISTAGVNLKDTKEMLGSLKTDLSSTIEKLNNIKDSGSYDMLLKVLGLDADSFGSFVASPVEIETEAIYPIATYGSADYNPYTLLQ